MTALPWFKVKTTILDDVMLGLLEPADRWHYVALLACKGAGLLDRSYPSPELRERALAKKLDLSVEAFRLVVATLSEVGLVHEDGSAKRWDEHQAQGDTSAARMRKHRAKKATEKGGAAGSEPARDGGDGHGDVTRDAPLPDVTALDREVDRDTDTEPNNVTARSAPATPAVVDVVEERAELVTVAQASNEQTAPGWRTQLDVATATTATTEVDVDAVPETAQAYLDWLVEERGYEPRAVRRGNALEQTRRWLVDQVTLAELGDAVDAASEANAGALKPVRYLAAIIAGEREQGTKGVRTAERASSPRTARLASASPPAASPPPTTPPARRERTPEEAAAGQDQRERLLGMIGMLPAMPGARSDQGPGHRESDVEGAREQVRRLRAEAARAGENADARRSVA